MKKYLLILFISMATICFSQTSFINYYNNPSNWTSTEVEQGTLIINEVLILDQEYILPNNIEVKIIKGGEIYTKYNLELTGDPNNPSPNNPREIFLKKQIQLITIINNLLLD